MKTQKKWKMWLVLAAAVCLLGAYGIFSPKGALRFAIVRSGHPIKAVTSVIGPPDYEFAHEGQIGYSLQNPPYEAVTGSDLCNWVVSRRGTVYWGEYYGNG